MKYLHTMVRVTDIDASCRFYCDGLGLREVRRIKNGGVLHFWLHPHNLGADVSRGIQRLEQVLDVIDRKAPRGTTYASMHDLA